MLASHSATRLKPMQGRFRPAPGGFTLIELIVVIVILGVLAAVALPRFTGLQGDARTAKANAMAGSIRAAAALTKSTAIVRAVACTAATGSVTMEGQAVAVAYCAPAATAAGIVVAANLSAANDNVTIASAAGVTTVQMNGAATLATCQVTYAEPTGADLPPTITVATGGC